MNEKIIKQEATYDWLKDEVHCLYAEKKELQKRIDKAIEYIENNTYEKSDNECGYTYDWNVRDLYNILKGSDKDANL